MDPEVWEEGTRALGFLVSNQEAGASAQSPLRPTRLFPAGLPAKAPPQPGVRSLKAPGPVVFPALCFWANSSVASPTCARQENLATSYSLRPSEASSSILAVPI